MNQKRLFVALLFSAAACGDDATAHLAPPTGLEGSRIRSPCDASALLLHQDLHLRCQRGSPLPPTSEDPRYWRGEKPCRRRIEYLDGQTPAPPVTVYDYSKPWELQGAAYNPDGNIVEYSDPNFAGGKATYEYEDGYLTGATFSSNGNKYALEYDDDRKQTESGGGTTYYYVYDDDGRLEAEGLAVRGAPPVRYDRSFLEPNAQGELPMVPTIDVERDGVNSASAPMSTYFYNADDRFETIGTARAPGLSFIRHDFSYEGGRLISVTQTGGADSPDPSSRPQRWTYEYCD